MLKGINSHSCHFGIMPERKAYFKKQSPTFKEKPDENCNPEKKLKSVTKELNQGSGFTKMSLFSGQ